MSSPPHPNRYDLVALGYISRELLASVERFPGAGDAIHAHETLWTGGGMAANTAHAVARLGGRVAMVAAIGDDGFGDEVVQQLEQDGIDTEAVFRRAGQPTPVVILMVDPETRRAGLVLNTATHDSLRSEEVPDELLGRTRIFFTDLNPPVPALEVAEQAKALGAVVAFDMQMTAAHINRPDLTERVDRMASLSDFVFCDEENFLLWHGQPTLDGALAVALTTYPSATFVVTSGAKGATIANGRERVQVSAFRVEAVDSIGAGDAFHGAFLLAHLVLGWAMVQAGRFASAVAALSCRAAGARHGLPTMAEAMRFMEGMRAEG